MLSYIFKYFLFILTNALNSLLVIASVKLTVVLVAIAERMEEGLLYETC